MKKKRSNIAPKHMPFAICFGSILKFFQQDPALSQKFYVERVTKNESRTLNHFCHLITFRKMIKWQK